MQVGQDVQRGTPLFRLDDRELRSQLEVKPAALRSAQADVSRLESLPRAEQVPVTEATLAEAEATAREKRSIYERLTKLKAGRAVSEQEIDTALHAMEAADADVQRAKAELALLKAGAWAPELEIARTAVLRAQSEVDAILVDLDRLTVPRIAGWRNPPSQSSPRRVCSRRRRSP